MSPITLRFGELAAQKINNVQKACEVFCQVTGRWAEYIPNSFYRKYLDFFWKLCALGTDLNASNVAGLYVQPSEFYQIGFQLIAQNLLKQNYYIPHGRLPRSEEN